jgi:hypothetical protein
VVSSQYSAASMQLSETASPYDSALGGLLDSAALRMTERCTCPVEGLIKIYFGVFLKMFNSTGPPGPFTSNTLSFSLAGYSLPGLQSMNTAAGPLARQP